MSFGLLAVLLMAPVQLDPQGAQRPKIIVLDLVNGAELADAQIEALGDAIVTALSGAPVEVLSAADLRKTIEVKASQSALGCVQGDCLLDLARLGRRATSSPDRSLSFEADHLNLKLIDSDNDNLKVLLRETVEAKPEVLTALARISAAKVRQKLGGPPPSDEERAVLRAENVPLIGLSIGLAGLGGLIGASWFQLEASDRATRAGCPDRPDHRPLPRRPRLAPAKTARGMCGLCRRLRPRVLELEHGMVRPAVLSP